MTLTSLWRERHPAAAPPDDVVLAGRRWDVVVVGAGLTGLTTALLLARAGSSVLVLEARSVGAGTTGSSTAKVSLLQGTTLSRMARRQSRETVAGYVRANQEALAWVDHYARQRGVDLQKRSAYTYSTSARGRRSVEREMEVAQGAGLPVQWSDTPELPFETQGAARLDEQSQVDPLELLAALVADVWEHGGAVAEGVRVRGVNGRGPLTVETSHGTVESDAVVVATNMPVLDRGGYFARAVPQRSYAAAFTTAAPALQGMYLSADSPTRSLRSTPGPDGEDVLLVGGNGHTTGRGGSTQRRVDDLLDWTRAVFGTDRPTNVWSAQDYTPASALPYVGPLLPGRDDLLVAGGYAKWGMTNAVSAALALSGRLLGGHIAWAEVYDPWAAHQLGRGALDIARYNAEVGVEMVRGWLVPGWGSAPADDAGLRHRGPRPTAVCQVGGEERKFSAVCTHLGGIVRWNDAERSWDCPLHGSRFDVDGEVLEGPATTGLHRA